MATYLIVGATGGIGSAVCDRLAQPGTNLVLAARDSTKLEALADRLRSRVQSVQTQTMDVTIPGNLDRVFQSTLEQFGRVDGAAFLVGSIVLKPIHLTTDEEWEQTLTINLRSAFGFVRAAIRAMMTTGGSIVLASSVAAQIGLLNHEAIAAAKGGIDALVRSTAATYAAKGIRVNAVAPGLVRTPLSSRLTSSETALKASLAMHPLGRIGEPDDVALPLCWLLNPESSWVTGQILRLDAGMSSIKTK